MKSALVIAFAGFALLLAGLPARAHHSFAAEYDANKPFKMSGVVTKFEMINPHSWLHMDIKEPDGTVVSWSFETAPPVALFRRGFKKDFLKPGTVVTIEGYLAKDGSHTGNAQKVTLPDGTQIVLGTETSPG